MNNSLHGTAFALGCCGAWLALILPILGLADEPPPGKSSAEVLNEWRAWRDDELRQLAIRRKDAERFSRASPESLLEFRPAVAEARKSTVELLDAGGKRLCYGVAVHAGGYVLTKASEASRAGDAMQCRFQGGITVTARASDFFTPYDLALIQIDATGLRPVTWHTASIMTPGTLAAAAGTDEDPVAIGVLSVASRSLNPGFLGIKVAESEDYALVDLVIPKSAAEASGVQSGDRILKVDDHSIKSGTGLIELIKQYGPGDEVILSIQRAENEMSISVILGARNAVIPPGDPNARMLSRMRVPVSSKRTGFPSAVQHDLVLAPDQCGGLLVDIEGNAIGLNIARAGRTQSFAIPAIDLLPLLETVAEGTFSLPNPEAIKEQLEKARETVKNAGTALEEAQAKEEELNRALDNLRKYRLPETVAPDQPEETTTPLP